MSDSSMITVVKGNLKISFYDKYQGSCCLQAALAAAYSLYSHRPQSYFEIFTKKEFNIVCYHDKIPEEDICRAYGETCVVIDLKKETVNINFYSFLKSMDDGESPEHKIFFIQILNECKKTKALKTLEEEVASTASLIDLIWDEDCGQCKEEYAFLDEKIFKYPFSKLGLLHNFFKDFIVNNQSSM
jgi:hypothetical protein